MRAWVNLLTLHFKPKGRMGGLAIVQFRGENPSATKREVPLSTFLFCTHAVSEQMGETSPFGLPDCGSGRIKVRRKSVSKRRSALPALVTVCTVSFAHPCHSQSCRYVVCVDSLGAPMYSHNEKQAIATISFHTH